MSHPAEQRSFSSLSTRGVSLSERKRRRGWLLHQVLFALEYVPPTDHSIPVSGITYKQFLDALGSEVQALPSKCFDKYWKVFLHSSIFFFISLPFILNAVRPAQTPQWYTVQVEFVDRSINSHILLLHSISGQPVPPNPNHQPLGLFP